MKKIICKKTKIQFKNKILGIYTTKNININISKYKSLIKNGIKLSKKNYIIAKKLNIINI